MPPQDAPKLEGSAKHRENNDGTQGKYIKYLINSWSELLKEHHYIMMKIIQEASLSRISDAAGSRTTITNYNNPREPAVGKHFSLKISMHTQFSACAHKERKEHEV